MGIISRAKRGQLFVLSAPSGTGKTVLVKRLTNELPSIVRSISFTTREPREGEKEGVDYFFVTKSDFEKRIQEGEFLEHVQLYEDDYGTSKSWVEEKLESGKHVVLVIDTQGAMLLKKRGVEATFIFVAPPSFEELRARLEKRRTESESVIQERLEWAKKELSLSGKYDYCVINDDLDAAYVVLKSIFIAEEHRRK